MLQGYEKNKVPKRSHVSKYKFANFPRSFINKLKQKCRFTEQNKTKFSQDKESYERKFLALNRLEAYLLKCVIPFIRIAHCPRGPYLKVKGDLILISSDIDHSLAKVLPVNQSLIPVCFKRKLAYSGSYIEEYIEKEKIKMYFDFFKKNNHLYKDINLDRSLINEFEAGSMELARTFEGNTKEESVPQSDEQDEEITEAEHIDEIFFEKSDTHSYETSQLPEDEWTNNKMTLFLNKYCEDINMPTVANRVADIIVDYESNNDIPILNEDDFEVDDEIISEEQFLRNVDEELDNQSQVTTIDIQDQLSDSEEIETPQQELATENKLEKESCEDLDTLYSPSQEQSDEISEKSHRKAAKIMQKMEKICVAPGEHGGFRN